MSGGMVFLYILTGFIVATILKWMVGKGLHHTVHCIETISILLVVIFQANKLYEWFCMITICTLLFRHIFRVIGDCVQIATNYKLEKK